MRLHVDVNRIERGLTNRRADGKSSWFTFPPGRTPLTDTVDMKAVLRRTFIFPIFLIAYFAAFFALKLTVIAVSIGVRYHHYVHHINWRLLTVLYREAFRIAPRVSFAEYSTITISFTMLFLAFLLASRWAWNRRANRLNRVADAPQGLPTLDTSVWPPPPAVSASADTLPRI